MEYYNNENMRRGDRALPLSEAQRVLREGEYGVLSLLERVDGEDGCYGVPINYVWDGGEFIYLHSAAVGHKLECVDLSPNVSFCIVGSSQVQREEFSSLFESVIVRGRIERVFDAQQRREALELLVEKYSLEHRAEGLKCIEKYFSSTEVLSIRISSVSGKGKYN